MKKRIFLKRGMGTMAAIALMGGSMVVGLTLVTVTATSHRLSSRGAEKQQALALAESGIEDLYARIQAAVNANTDFPLSLSGGSVNHDQNTTTKEGTYTARVVTTTQHSVDSVYGTDHYRNVDYDFVLEGNGVSNLGVKGRLRAHFTGHVVYALSRVGSVTTLGDQPQQLWFPRGAMAANEQVNFVTNNLVNVQSSVPGAGHILANGGISWQPASGAKASFGNTTVINADGQFIVDQPSLAFTQSTGGMANPNGQINFQSPAIGLNPANKIWQSQARINFVDQPGVANWDLRWQQNGGRDPARVFTPLPAVASLPASDVTPTGNMLETPAYVKGGLTVPAGQTLVLKPTSSNPMKNVIYLEGNVVNQGNIVNLGVKLVFRGKYSEGSGASYNVSEVGSPFATRQRTLQNAALISLAADPQAINFTSTTDSSVGLVYAASGGVRLAAPGRTTKGALIAGGVDGNGSITVNNGTSGTNTLVFEKDATVPGDIDLSSIDQIDINYVISGVYSPFVATQLGNWLELDNMGKAVVTKTGVNLITTEALTP